MAKLNMLYYLSQFGITNDIDQFWEGIVIPRKHFVIDADNILGIFSYIIS
jgi:hypothetical protein